MGYCRALIATVEARTNGAYLSAKAISCHCPLAVELDACAVIGPALPTVESLPMLRIIKRFLKCKSGTTSVEYAVVMALILVVCMGAVQAVGQALNTALTNVSSSIAPHSPIPHPTKSSGS
jgi:pilus assembly protein Flp/PilA